MKKINALALALFVMVQLMLPVGATYNASNPNATIQVNSAGNFTFYQLYSYDSTTQGYTQNTAFTSVLDKPAYDFTTDSFTNALKNTLMADLNALIASTSPTAHTTGSGNTAVSVNLGYYFITGTSLAGADLPSALVLVTQANTSYPVDLKSISLTMVKEIEHNEIPQWRYEGDNQIGDDVNFRISSALPDDISQFDDGNYIYTITDTMDATLNYNSDLTIYTTSDGSGTPLTLGTHYSMRTVAGKTFTVDVKVAQVLNDFSSADTLYLFFSAELLSTAALAPDPNVNTAYLTYSNDPSYTSNPSYTGTDNGIKDANGNDYTPGGSEDGNDRPGLGEITNPVYDYSFVLEVSKVDATSGDLLDGAVFALQDDDNKYLTLAKNGDGKYYVTGSSTSVPGTADCITTVSGTPFYIIGLDDATSYKLEEITAPTGYNLLEDPVTFKITAGYDANYALNSLNMDVDGTTVSADGDWVLAMEIENKSGLILPETGGIGSVMYHVLGGGLVCLAAVLLILKRRNFF